MNGFLLDASLLIAMCDPDHVHHGLAEAWMLPVGSFAVCPIVEGALVRYYLRAGAEREVIGAILREIANRSGYHHWPDSVPYRDVDLSRVRGHRQVTDAYLVALTRAHPGWQLATLDRGLADAHPDVVHLVC